MLQRVFLIDVLRCRCGGLRTVLAAIHDPDSIRKVLSAMGLSSEVPVLAAARGPPEQGEWWGA
ncbi:MAG: ATP-dependent helicase HrpA [bacterium]|nr:ATP-dependent helicase HrpA [bacterium]